MTLTNRLGTADSQLGNITLGAAASTATETIYPDRYEATWRLPIWKARPVQQPALALNQNLEASVWPEDPVATETPWDVPLSLPVRPRPRQRVVPPLETLDASYLGSEEKVYPEAFTPSWGVPWLRVRCRDTYLSPFAILDPTGRAEVIDAEVLAGMGVPTLTPRRLRSYGAMTLDLEPGQQGEAILVSEWHRLFDRPVPARIPPRMPWLLAMGEEYSDTTFETVIAVKAHRPLGMWSGGF